MSETTKTLLVIEPNVRLAPKVLRALEESGFLVVRGVPSDFHVIGHHPVPSDPLVLQAALDAIRTFQTSDNWVGNAGNAMRNRFARTLAAKLGYGDVVKI